MGELPGNGGTPQEWGNSPGMGTRVLRVAGRPRSDLDDGGPAQAQRRVRGHRVPLDLVAVQPQHLQPRVVHHVHHGAETADGELWGGEERREEVNSCPGL